MATNGRFENGKNCSIGFEISSNKSTVRFDAKWKTSAVRTALFCGRVSELILNIFCVNVNEIFTSVAGEWNRLARSDP